MRVDRSPLNGSFFRSFDSIRSYFDSMEGNEVTDR
jgi:hypothetical protein